MRGAHPLQLPRSMRAWMILLGLAASCGGASDLPAAADLQMNDLSVLLPLARTQAELDTTVRADAPARGGALLPEAIYTSSGNHGGDYASLRAVAFRLDPCFGQLGAITDPSACHAQLRVVFQPVLVATDGTVLAQDVAVHAFYALTPDELLGAVSDMVAARIADNGSADLGPLAPNRIVAAEGLGGELAQQYAAILTKYAGQANLVRFTDFEVAIIFAPDAPAAVGANSLVWGFDSFDVAPGAGAATGRPIPTLSDARTTMSFQAGTNPLAATFSPMTTSADNLVLMVNYTEAMQAARPAQQAAFDAALRIEDPHASSPDTIDCASCHMAQPARELVGAKLGLAADGNPNAFVADAAIPVADLAETTQLVGSDGGLNIHAFSYRGQDPMINRRVIDETAANLAYIATLLP